MEVVIEAGSRWSKVRVLTELAGRVGRTTREEVESQASTAAVDKAAKVEPEVGWMLAGLEVVAARPEEVTAVRHEEPTATSPEPAS